MKNRTENRRQGGMTDKTAPQRVARDKARKKLAGLVRVEVWVPAAARDQILALARKLRGT